MKTILFPLILGLVLSIPGKCNAFQARKQLSTLKIIDLTHSFSTPITSAEAVIPTNPPRIHLRTLERSLALYLSLVNIKVLSPPAEAAVQVVTSAGKYHFDFLR